MRKVGWIAAMAAVLLAWWLWPYAGAYTLAKAAQSHDAEALLERIDQPALKRSLARQIVTAYLRKSGRADKMGAWERGLANAVGTSIATPYLDGLLSPDTLSTLLGDGRLAHITVEGRTIDVDQSVPALPSLYGAPLLHVLLHSAYDGIASFRFGIPAGGDTADDDYGVHMRLSGLTWRLSGLDLPPGILDRIAADAIAAEKRTGAPG